MNERHNFLREPGQTQQHMDAMILIGPQGSGKGTQAKILEEELGFFHWDNGGILRKIATENSEIGLKVKHLTESGILLDDRTMMEVVEFELHELDPHRGILFDGLPRRLSQAEFLLAVLKKQGRNSIVTLFIDIPEEEAYKRIEKRGQEEGRVDDQDPEKVRRRLHQYYTETVPVLDYLKSRTSFFDIDGLPPIEQVSQNICRALALTPAETIHGG